MRTPWHRQGPGGSRCRLNEARSRRLAEALEELPAAHRLGVDKRWTLARVSDLIAGMFRSRYTLRGISPQVLGDVAHAPGVDAGVVGERDGRVQHPVPVEGARRVPSTGCLLNPLSPFPEAAASR